MDATTLLITVYCLIDDWLAGRRLRQRGPRPTLADSEVLNLWSRWQRKLLSHTIAVYLCQQHGLGSLRFADLLAS
jgi:hypothetical protein